MLETKSIVLQSLKDNSKDVIEYVRNVKMTFSVEDLCLLLHIDRNRYNYIKRKHCLDWYIAKLGGYVS
jgi:hypothetical protein